MSAILTVAALAVAGVGSAAAQEPGCQSIVDAIGANGLNRLGEAVLGVAGEDEAADLAALATATTPLPESEKVTIFAPNDAAWPAPEDLPTDASDIIDILLGHVVPAYLRSEDVLGALAADGKATLMSLAGTDVIASLEGEDVYVAAEGMEMPGAKAVAFDVETCAGVIHVIDKVLIASPEDDMMDDGMMMDDGDMMGNDTMMGNCTTLVDAITKEGLSRLGEAVLSLEENANATGLLTLATQSMELPEDQKITLFAPNNSAWPPVAALPTGDDLLAVLNGHIVPAYLPSAAAINATANETVTLDTLEMTKLNATQEAGELYIAAEGMMGPGAKVIAVDVETCIGVVHVVDKVLIADDALNATTSEPAEMDEEETEGEEQATEETTRSTIPSGTEVTPNGAASDLVFGAVASVAAAAALLI